MKATSSFSGHIAFCSIIHSAGLPLIACFVTHHCALNSSLSHSSGHTDRTPSEIYSCQTTPLVRVCLRDQAPKRTVQRLHRLHETRTPLTSTRATILVQSGTSLRQIRLRLPTIPERQTHCRKALLDPGHLMRAPVQLVTLNRSRNGHRLLPTSHLTLLHVGPEKPRTTIRR